MKPRRSKLARLSDDIRSSIDGDADANLNGKMVDIKARVYRLMREKGIDDYTLAQQLGITKSGVVTMFDTKRNLSMKTICRLEEVLGADIVTVVYR